jgi:adenylate kinase family enzyme
VSAGNTRSPELTGLFRRERPRRVAIVGSSGAGKTWLARRLANILAVEHVELDAIHHGPNWTALPAEAMRAALDLRCPPDGAWVADGNYQHKGGDLVRDRAEVVVWIDLSRTAVMRQLILRTAWRALLRTPLWNGNRESLRDALSRDPERSVLLWSWTRHEPQRRRYHAQRDERWIRLTSRSQLRGFLAIAETSKRTSGASEQHPRRDDQHARERDL